MSDPVDPTGAEPGPERQKDARTTRYRRKRGPLGEHVASVVGGLQARYTRDRPDPGAIAELALLRKAIHAEPGTSGMTSIWLPDALLESDWAPSEEERRATPNERALHTAVTLFAVHQQSRRDAGMHTGDATFAAAVQRLAHGDGKHYSADNPVYKRFSALGTAATYDELTHHARHLVKQLRGERIGFDYGLFADDLRTFQLERPLLSGVSGPDHIRALWGREYWRSRPAAPAPPAEGTPDTTNDQE